MFDLNNLQELKLTGYYSARSQQIYATFVFNNVEFDMIKNLKQLTDWAFIEDKNLNTIFKVVDKDELFCNCKKELKLLDQYFQ